MLRGILKPSYSIVPMLAMHCSNYYPGVTLTALIQAVLTWSKRAPGCVNTTFFEHHGIKRTYITSEGHNENAITDISMFSDETTMLRDYHTTCSRAAFLIHHFQQHFHFFRHTDSRECTMYSMMSQSENDTDSQCIYLPTSFIPSNSAKQLCALQK